MRQKIWAILTILLLLVCVYLQGLQQQGKLPGSYLISVEDCAVPTVSFYTLDDTLKAARTNEEHRPCYNLGTCNSLEGHQVVALFFVNDNQSTWSAEDVRHFTNKHVLPSLLFLQKQAQRWGVELSFSIKRYSTPLAHGQDITYNGSIFHDATATNASWKMPSSLSVSWGFPSDLLMLSNLFEETGGLPVIPIFIFNKSGRSHAWPQAAAGACDFLEHGVIFADYPGHDTGNWKSNNAAASTIAHEILHLFGAEDYYYEENQNRDQRSILAAQYYPNDIMLQAYRELSFLKVNDVTAYSVGWTDQIPEILYNEDWYQ